MGVIVIRKKYQLIFSISAVLLLSACNTSNSNPIEKIQNEMHYMDVDNERQYVITFLEDNRADAAWYGREDSPESLTYEMSEDPVDVENQEPMQMISFDNMPTHSYGLSNSNDNSFLIDEIDEGIVLRDYTMNNEDNTLILSKDYEGAFTEATEENDIFLNEVE